VLEQLLGIREALGFQIGKTEKVGGFEVIVQRDGCLESVNSGGKIPAVEFYAAEDILGASVTWMRGDDGLGKLASFPRLPARNQAMAASTAISGSVGANLRA